MVRGGGGLGWLRVVEMKGSDDGRGYAWRVLSSHVLLVVVVVVPCVCVRGIDGMFARVCGPHMHLEPFLHVNCASRSNDGAIEARRLAGDLEASGPRLPACLPSSLVLPVEDGLRSRGEVWFTGLRYRRGTDCATLLDSLPLPRVLRHPSFLVPPNPDVLYVL